jgi:CubicO group peptidase (beta-lactamase class C family)
MVAVAPLLAGAAHAAPDAVDSLAATVMTRLHIPGMAIAVVRAGKIEKLATYGVANLESSTPVTTETRFQLASVTKIFTGTLLLQLIQEGKLGLSDPIAKYLPDAPPAWRGVTIAHLAAHASGIAAADAKPASTAAAYAAIRDRPLVFSPGARSSYAGGDFAVLVQILERVSGQPFGELLRQKVLEPLKLGCTSFEDVNEEGLMRTAKVIANRAWVYHWTGDEQRLAWFNYPPATYPAGGVFSSISDLVKWAVALDAGTLLSSASEKHAAAPFRFVDGRESSFGVVFTVGRLRGHRAYGHGGGPALADVMRLPDDKLTIIVLANQHRMYPDLAETLASMLLPQAPSTPIRDRNPTLSAALRAVADDYAHGRIAAAALAPSVRDTLAPQLNEWGPLITAAWPDLDRWSLIEESQHGSEQIRRYLARHGAVSVRWTFTLDSAGKILAIDSTPN